MARDQAASVLILDEPTRGIDVGAKAEIHALMGELARAGRRHPDDLQRTAGGAGHERPRAGDARGGAIVAEFDRAEATPEAVGRGDDRRPPAPTEAA